MDQLKLKAFLREAGISHKDAELTSVDGGSVNQAYKVSTREGNYFLKYHHDPPERFFMKEANNLRWIKEKTSVHVPVVHGVGEHFLLLSWLATEKYEHTAEQLGKQIAQLHETMSDQFGFQEDNYIATLPQINPLYGRWVDFYREARLYPQIQLAIDHERMSETRKKRSFQLLDGLEQFLAEPVAPSLLHGDLWGGNWLAASGGTPYLIDPACFYGDPTYDLAMMDLFGGFSERTFQAYHERIKPDPEAKFRKPLYQLYFLFVHLNMFGESYGQPIDRILKRYVG